MHILSRVSPAIPNLKKLKTSIDAGVSKKDILTDFKDPHLYTSVIKHFLRELPDPLLCSRFTEDWISVNSIKDDLEQMKGIKELIERIPVANKNNISFLFCFLSKLVDEEFYNKMSIKNLIVVLSPNLLWDQNGDHIPLGSVYKTMIEHYEMIFEDIDSLTTNPYGFITNNMSLASLGLNEEKEVNIGEDESDIESPKMERKCAIKRTETTGKRNQDLDQSLVEDKRLPARTSTENLNQMDELIGEDEQRKTSKHKVAHNSMLPSPKISISSTTGSSSDPTLNSPTTENNSFKLGDSMFNVSLTTLDRYSLIERIPKINFSMPKRKAKSEDVNRQPARISMENIFLTLTKDELIAEDELGNSSISYEEDAYTSMMSSPEILISSTTESFADPAQRCLLRETNSLEPDDSKMNMSSPTLKRYSLMERIPKLNFSMPKRKAKSWDVNK